MNWEALGAIGELVGAVAIIVTLVYLAFQVKYARIAATDASRANRVQGIHQIDGQFMESPELRKAWLKAGGPGLTGLIKDLSEKWGTEDEETLMLMSTSFDWAWLHWAQFRSIKTPSDEAELKNIISVFYAEDPMLSFVEHPIFRSYFEKPFIEFVDDILGK